MTAISLDNIVRLPFSHSADILDYGATGCNSDCGEWWTRPLAIDVREWCTHSLSALPADAKRKPNDLKVEDLVWIIEFATADDAVLFSMKWL